MRPSEARASDAELIERTKTGDADAFEILMERYYERVYGVIGRMVRDAEKARDLAQECFFRAWRSIGTYAGEAAFYTWLYQISRNVVISEARRQRARPRVVASLDQGREDDDDARLNVADESAEPQRAASRRERRRVLIDAVDALPPDFREIIVLSDMECLSYEEIAAMLGIPVGTVRSRLHRARAELRSRVADVLQS